MKKRISLLLFVLVLSMLISACGKTQTSEPAEEVPAAQTQETVEAPAVEEPAAPAEPEKTPAPEKVTEDDFVIETDEDGNYVIISYLGSSADVEIPQTIKGKTVVGIGAMGFANSSIERIVLSDSIRYIAEGAFTNCSFLKEIVFSSGLERIDNKAFNNCPSLESLAFPESLVSISGMCFGLCGNLKEVYVPATTTDIPNGIANAVMCPNLVIVTPAGSVAESVANEAGIPVRNS